mmetsp:Transcript_28905/g.60444  ORF Transcript_28905/g.60444 Transcript_28905/m.60444 type:complete len:387 (+) Transcript_28905:58-1218(+)
MGVVTRRTGETSSQAGSVRSQSSSIRSANVRSNSIRNNIVGLSSVNSFDNSSASHHDERPEPDDIQQEDPEDRGIIDADPAETDGLMRPTTRMSRCWHCFCRLLIVAVLLACVTFVIADVALPSSPHRIEKASVWFLDWVAQHPTKGILAVIAIFAIATVLFMPAAVLTMGAGFAFHSAFDSFSKGVVLGSIAVFCGAVLGSISAFLIGRYLFRQTVMGMASKYPMFRAIDRALQGNGLKIMFLLRLSPLIPYNALDYISGVTSIPLWSYACAMIGMLPGTVMFVAIGATASSLSDEQQWTDKNRMLNMSAIVSGLVFAIGGVAMASYYSKIELEKILQQERQERRQQMRGRNFPSPPRLHPHEQQFNLHELGTTDLERTNLHDLL